MTYEKSCKLTAALSKAAGRHRLLMALIGVTLLSLLLFSCQNKEDTPAAQKPKAGLQPLATEKQSVELPQTERTADLDLLPFIQAINFRPTQPTRGDSLEAEIVLKPGAPDLTFRYIWKVNDRGIPDAAGSTLDLTPFKVRDLVTVSIIASDGQREGAPVNSPVVAIHNRPPTLELKPFRDTMKAGSILILQLISTHPDTPQISFALAEPRIAGMTIDSQTGIITWVVQPDQKGPIRFGASVEDADHTVKVTKEFELLIE